MRHRTLLQYVAVAAPVLVPVVVSTQGGGPGIRTGTVPFLQYQATAAPVVVPSAVIASPLSGQPRYRDRIDPRRRLHASRQIAWFFDEQYDAPAAVAAPDLILGQQSEIVRRKYNRAPYVPGHPPFGVEVQVPVMSWTGDYPWALPQWKKRWHVARNSATVADLELVPAVVVPPDMAVPVYPDFTRRARRVPQFPQPAWPAFTADATVVVPPLSWSPRFPHKVYPKRSLHVSLQAAQMRSENPIPTIAVEEVTGRGRFVVPRRIRGFIVPQRKRKFIV